MHNLSLSIITPAYNEEESITSAVRQNLDVISNMVTDFEMLIVNDGSTDKTGVILDNEISKWPVRIIHKEKNGGLGSAIRAGVSQCTKEFILCIPVDSPLTEEGLKGFIINAHKADIIVSFRTKRKGYSWWMNLNSIVFQWCITHLFNMNLRDYNWIHMYHRKIFFEGGIQIESNGLFMLAEILVKAKRLGYTFFEFEIEQAERLTGIASASKLKNVLKTIKDMLSFYLKPAVYEKRKR